MKWNDRDTEQSAGEARTVSGPMTSFRRALARHLGWWLPRAGGVGLAAILLGCSNLRPVEDTRRFLILTPGTEVRAEADAGPTRAGLRVGSIVLPEYVLRSAIVLHRSEAEVRLSEHWHWGERLDKGVRRALNLSLARSVRPGELRSEWSRDGQVWDVSVQFHRFGWERDGRAVLAGRWELEQAEQPEACRAGDFKLEAPGPLLEENPDGAIAALMGLIDRLSRDLAAAWNRRGDATAH